MTAPTARLLQLLGQATSTKKKPSSDLSGQLNAMLLHFSQALAVIRAVGQAIKVCSPGVEELLKGSGLFNPFVILECGRGPR